MARNRHIQQDGRVVPDSRTAPEEPSSRSELTPLAGNLFADLPLTGPDEAFSELFAAPGARIERIVSRGHASPPGFWYDQPQVEWVVVLQGSADLTIHGEPASRRLGPGDHLLLPAGCRHRVERTDDPTVWLAVHVG